MMNIQPNRTAVVCIEFQNEFCSPGGAFFEAVRPVIEANDTINNAVQVVNAAREAGCTVIHVPIWFAAGYPEVNPATPGVLANIVNANAFRQGSWGADFCPEMAPRAGEVVCEGKRGLDAFATTNLEFILRQNNIQNVVLCGFLTNVCVESTMRTAYERGFNVWTVTNATACTSAEEQRVACDFDFKMFSTPVTAAVCCDAFVNAVAAVN